MIFINTNCSGYAPEQCGRTVTVSELISTLQQYNPNSSIYFRNDNGYTYGSITENDITDGGELT